MCSLKLCIGLMREQRGKETRCAVSCCTLCFKKFRALYFKKATKLYLFAVPLTVHCHLEQYIFLHNLPALGIFTDANSHLLFCISVVHV